MPRKRNNQKWMILLVIILVPLLFAAGYTLSSGNAGEQLRRWFGMEGTIAPSSDGDETVNPAEPDNNNFGEIPAEERPCIEPSEATQDEEGPANPESDEDNPGKTPVIYVGQVLTIPVTGGSSSGKSQVIEQGTVAADVKQIALTFDSGWEYTHAEPLLNVLNQYGVKATFFPRADWLKTHPDLGQKIVKGGHTVGNHSKTHGDMTKEKMSAAKIREEMRESTRIIKEICGVDPYLFRPPYGAYDSQLLEILAEEGYPYTIMWTVDTLDWDAGNTRKVGGKDTLIDEDFIVNRALTKASNNGIILMHIGGHTSGHLTVPALPRIIEGLRDQGYSFTTVDKMLPPPATGGKTTYTVQKGDTLYSISRRYGITVQQLIDANNL